MATQAAPPIEAITSERDDLPITALLALAMTGFTAILTETLPAGLLPQIASGLAVSPSHAGQLVTAYAVGSIAAAIPLTTMTQGWRRKPTLLIAISGFLVFNTVTAVSDHYPVTLAARFLAGVAAGLAWGMLAGYARRMVPDRLKGRALAVAMVGTPLALSIGVPGGAFIGATIGWRPAFLAMSATTLVLIGWVVWKMPDFAGHSAAERQRVIPVFLRPGIRPILAVIFLWMTAHNILYTYVAPYAERAGIAGHVDLLLLGFGLAALAGIWIAGVGVDRRLRTLTLASLAAFAAMSLVLVLAGQDAWVLSAAILVWGVSFGGAATYLQTASADAAGAGVDVANAMITTVWNAAIAAGGIVGGIMLERWGTGSFPPATLTLAILALLLVFRSRRHGFQPGPRAAA